MIQPSRRERPVKKPATRQLPGGRRGDARRAATFHFASEDDKLRALNAIRVRGVDTGYESMSELVSDLVMTWVEEQEWSANGGRPFSAEQRARRRDS